MATKAKPIPDGFRTLTPYLYVQQVGEYVAFLKRAFGAEQIAYNDLGGGHVHAEVKIGDSMIMLGAAPNAPTSIYMYVPDVDVVYQCAIAAGAKSVEAPADKPYGDRNAHVVDPFGITWFIGTHIEDVSEDEVKRRFAAAARA